MDCRNQPLDGFERLDAVLLVAALIWSLQRTCGRRVDMQKLRSGIQAQDWKRFQTTI
jgi:hypothetical protein